MSNTFPVASCKNVQRTEVSDTRQLGVFLHGIDNVTLAALMKEVTIEEDLYEIFKKVLQKRG
jgi:translation initiation factor 6 (eIF-6)